MGSFLEGIYGRRAGKWTRKRGIGVLEEADLKIFFHDFLDVRFFCVTY
jgi:hypothetical protein